MVWTGKWEAIEPGLHTVLRKSRRLGCVVTQDSATVSSREGNFGRVLAIAWLLCMLETVPCCWRMRSVL